MPPLWPYLPAIVLPTALSKWIKEHNEFITRSRRVNFRSSLCQLQPRCDVCFFLNLQALASAQCTKCYCPYVQINLSGCKDRLQTVPTDISGALWTQLWERCHNTSIATKFLYTVHVCTLDLIKQSVYMYRIAFSCAVCIQLYHVAYQVEHEDFRYYLLQMVDMKCV